MNERISRKISSRELSNIINKKHSYLVYQIDRIKKTFMLDSVISEKLFKTSSYKSERGKVYKYYIIDVIGLELLHDKIFSSGRSVDINGLINLSNLIKKMKKRSK